MSAHDEIIRNETCYSEGYNEGIHGLPSDNE